MIRVAFARVKPDKVERLREWLRELMTRQDEVRQTFVQETVRHEQAFVIESAHGPIMIYVMEAEDHARARNSYRTSSLLIDQQHRQVMDEVLEGKLEVEPLYDCRLDKT